MGVLLILVAIGTSGATGHDRDTRLAALAAERSALLRNGAETRFAGAGPTGEALDAFYAGFPAAVDIPAILSEVHARAEDHGVDLERADYRLSDERGTPLRRVGLNLPVRANFRVLYAWLGELSTDMPALGFEAFSLRRSDPRTGFIEGELRMSLFVKAEPR